MMFHLRLLLSISILIVSVSTHSLAQSDNLFSKGLKMQKELDFQGAISIYQQLLEKEKSYPAMSNLAECYRRLGDYTNASRYYAMSAEHENATSDMTYYLGMCQLADDDLASARSSFVAFKKKERAQLRAHNMVAAMKGSNRTEMMNAGSLYDIVELSQLNTKFDDLGACFYDGGIIYFSDMDTSKASSLRGSWMLKPYVKPYFVSAVMADESTKTFRYGNPTEYVDVLNLSYHDGPILFNSSMDMGYYTKFGTNTSKANHLANTLNSNIAFVKKDGDQWSDPISGESISVNNVEYSVAFPYLTNDGYKMYFSSDVPGGFGGYDLYVSYNEDGVWSKPVNLGPEVNTEGDEIYPYMDEEGYFYFSSDGQTGLGGFDIYYTRSNKGIWDPAINLGYPINSSRDDISFVTDSSGTYGYFSSNRLEGKGGMDIYAFKRVALETELLIFDKHTGQGISGVEVISDCLSSRTTYTTNIDGRLFIPLPMEKDCNLSFISEQLDSFATSFSTKGYTAGSELFINVPVTQKKLDFSVEGMIVDQNNIAIPDATISLISECSDLQRTETSKLDGSYQFPLGTPCSFVIKVEKEGYLTTSAVLSTRGMAQSTSFNKVIQLLPQP